MNDLVPAFEVALADNNFKAVKEIWSELLEQQTSELPTLLKLALKVKQKNDAKRAASLLSMLLTTLIEQEKFEDAYDVARIIAEYNPNAKELFENLISLVPKVFSKINDIDVIVEKAQEDFDGNVKEFLDYIKCMPINRMPERLLKLEI